MKKFFVIFIVVVFCVPLAACGKKEQGKSGALSDRGEIIDAVKSDLTINGLGIPVPFSLDDLSGDFGFSDSRMFMEADGGTLLTYLTYKGESIADVQIYGIDEKDIKNDAVVRTLKVNYLGAVAHYGADISFDGVRVGDPLSAVEKWGEPTQKREGANAYMRYTGFDMNGTIATLTIYPSAGDSEKIGSILLNIK